MPSNSYGALFSFIFLQGLFQRLLVEVRLSLESTFLNCFHMSTPGTKITGRFGIGFISSHSNRIPVVKFPGSIFKALNIHIGTEKN